MNFRLQSQTGFTLVECLVAISVLTVFCFSLLVVLHKLNIEATNSSRDEQISATIDRIESAFGDNDRYCTYMLGGETVPPTLNTKQEVTRPIRFYSISGVPGEIIAQAGQDVAEGTDLFVSNVRLVLISDLGNSKVLTQLEIVFQRRNIEEYPIVRSFPFYAVKESGSDAIRLCSTTPWTSLTLYDRICRIDGHGYSHYDALKGECVDDENVIWVESDNPFLATCGPGRKPAAINPLLTTIEQHMSLCRSLNNARDILPPRSYADSTIDTQMTPVDYPTFNPETKSCAFTYIDGTDTSTIRTSIKCVPE